MDGSAGLPAPHPLRTSQLLDVHSWKRRFAGAKPITKDMTRAVTALLALLALDYCVKHVETGWTKLRQDGSVDVAGYAIWFLDHIQAPQHVL